MRPLSAMVIIALTVLAALNIERHSVTAELAIMEDKQEGCNDSPRKEMVIEQINQEAQVDLSGRQLTAIVLGGTGEIGKYLVKELLQSARFGRVISLQRRKSDWFPASDKLEQIIVNDFEKLGDAKYAVYFKGVDVAFNTFGTTRRDAGGADEFRRIDYGYSALFGQQCSQAKIPRVHLVTAQGSNKDSWFLYPQVKGQLEELYSSFNFSSLTIWRPGLLARDNPRRVEKLALYVLSGIPVSRVGQAMRVRAEQIEDFAQAGDLPYNFVETFWDAEMYEMTSTLHQASS